MICSSSSQQRGGGIIKRIILIFLLFSGPSITFAAQQLGGSQEGSQDSVSLDSVSLDSVSLDSMSLDSMSSCFQKVKSAFNNIAHGIDHLVSKLGLIKVGMVIVPLGILCIGLFSKDIAHGFSGFISRNTKDVAYEIGTLHGAYGYGYETGKYDAIQENLIQDPVSGISYIFINEISALIKYGLPFMAGAVFKTFFKLS